MYTLTTNNTISFVMEGTEQVLSLRAKITVDRDDIIDIAWHEKFNDWPSLQIRMPGTYLPRWVMAGSYWSEEGWDFVLAKKPKGFNYPLLFDVLVVRTKKDRYKRIIIRMEKDRADDVLKWWNE
jgi:hypothetical protein